MYNVFVIYYSWCSRTCFEFRWHILHK